MKPAKLPVNVCKATDGCLTFPHFRAFRHRTRVKSSVQKALDSKKTSIMKPKAYIIERLSKRVAFIPTGTSWPCAYVISLFLSKDRNSQAFK